MEFDNKSLAALSGPGSAVAVQPQAAQAQANGVAPLSPIFDDALLQFIPGSSECAAFPRSEVPVEHQKHDFI